MRVSKNRTNNEAYARGIDDAQKHFERIIQVYNNKLDELAKYKRAFEILKDSELIHFSKYEETDIYEIITGDGTQILTKEEYELLEELMSDENS